MYLLYYNFYLAYLCPIVTVLPALTEMDSPLKKLSSTVLHSYSIVKFFPLGQMAQLLSRVMAITQLHLFSNMLSKLGKKQLHGLKLDFVIKIGWCMIYDFSGDWLFTLFQNVFDFFCYSLSPSILVLIILLITI